VAWSNRGTIPAFAGRLRETRNVPVRRADVQAQIVAEYVSNKSLARYRYASSVGSLHNTKMR
jgi:hypothetical protein